MYQKVYQETSVASSRASRFIKICQNLFLENYKLIAELFQKIIHGSYFCGLANFLNKVPMTVLTIKNMQKNMYKNHTIDF